LDASTAIGFVAEGAWVRHHLKAKVSGKEMVMTETALREFQEILLEKGGPTEQSRASRLLGKVTVIGDNPSARAKRLKVTKNLGANDIVILGTGDMSGIETLTGDRKAVSAARSQGVDFQVSFHFSPRLKGV
jgi:hypothetical protein